MIRGGLLQRWERTIQPARIQSVDVVQKLTHRLFGVVELRIEVVGGNGAPRTLVALTPEEAKQLRALLMADHVADDDPTEPPLVRMRAADLLLAGATGGRVAVVAAIAGWAFQVLPEGHVRRDAGPSRRSRTVRLRDRPADRRGPADGLDPDLAREHDPRLLGLHRRAPEDDRLVITRGLLQTRRSVVPIARIQAIRLEENLVRRAFGLASLRVLTAGYGRDSGDEQQSSMLVPVADPRRDASSSRRRSSAPVGSPERPDPSRSAAGPRASPVPRRDRRCRGPSRSGWPSGTVRSRRRFPSSRSPSGSSSCPGGLSAMPSSDRTSWRAREPSCGARPSRTRRTCSICPPSVTDAAALRDRQPHARDPEGRDSVIDVDVTSPRSDSPIWPRDCRLGPGSLARDRRIREQRRSREQRGDLRSGHGPREVEALTAGCTPPHAGTPAPRPSRSPRRAASCPARAPAGSSPRPCGRSRRRDRRRG